MNIKSAQEILNELYGGGLSSVQEILNAVYSSGGQGNIIAAGSGLRYTSVQEAVDAAVAAGASASNPYTIVYGPGLAAEWTPTEGVTVVPQVKTWSIPRDRDVEFYTTIPDRYPLVFDVPLVAIINDDNKGAWMAVPDGAPLGDGITPMMYCAMHAVPVTHAVPASGVTIGKADHTGDECMTISEMKKCMAYQGATFECHSYTHGDTPTLSADVHKEVVESGKRLRSLALASKDERGSAPATGWSWTQQGTNTIWFRLGAIVSGFIEPGTWTFDGTYYQGVSWMESDLYRAIRENYEWHVYDMEPASIQAPGGYRPFLLSRKPLTAAVANGNVSHITSMPNTRWLLYFHGYGATINWTAWKTAIDALVAARNAGTLQLVSTRTAALGMTAPAQAARPAWGGLPNGSFTGLSSVPPDGNPYAGLMTTGGTPAIVEGDLGKCVELEAGDRIGWRLELPPGSTWLLRFKAKSSNGTNGVRILADQGWYEGGASHGRNVFFVRQFRAITNTSALVASPHSAPLPQYAAFTVPTWAQVMQVGIDVPTGQAGSVQIDDVELARI